MADLSLFNEEQLKDISQVLMFEDDSLEVQFKDQSILQLSPCGSNYCYTFIKTESAPIKLQHYESIKKRCIFATSESRTKVVNCLNIRNKLAQRPNIPVDFLSRYSTVTKVQMEKVVTSDQWTRDDGSSCISRHKDGSVLIESIRGYAKLTLYPEKNCVKVKYLAKLPGKENRLHVWSEAYFCVFDCPEAWKYPLQIVRDEINSVTIKQKICTRIEFPGTLPMQCQRQFSHKWREIIDFKIKDLEEESKKAAKINSEVDLILPLKRECYNIKFLWRDFNCFWIYKSKQGYQIESWPKDGSILQSINNSDLYFKHIEKGSKESTTVSPATMVGSTKTELKNVLLSCSRLRLYCKEYNPNAICSSCWCYKSDELIKALEMENETRIESEENIIISQQTLNITSKMPSEKVEVNPLNIRKALQGINNITSEIDDIIQQTRLTLGK